MTTKKGVDFMRAVAAFISRKGFDNVTQMIKITGGGDGRCIAEFTLKPEHLNGMGTLHGGLSATIIDNVTTYALMTKDAHPGVSVSLNVNYMSSAKEGEIVEIDAKTIRLGRTLAYMDCELRRKSDGKVLVTGAHTKYVDFDKSKFSID